MTMSDAATYEAAGAALRSPFSTTELFNGPAGGSPTSAWETGRGGVVSPFGEAMAPADGTDPETEALDALEAELADEQFDDGIEALTDEAAARHLRSLASWSSESESGSAARAELELWFESIAADVDRSLDELDARFGDRTVESLTETDLEAVGAVGAGIGPTGLDAQEYFLKQLWGKVKKVARGVGTLVKKGVSAVGRLLPLKKLWNILRKLIRPLLSRVLGKAIGRLPAAVQPAARDLAKKFGLQSEAEGGEDEYTPSAEFDHALAEMLAADDVTADAVAAEYGSRASDGRAGDPLGELDHARRTLAEQLASGDPGDAPVKQMEQFLPAVMAVLPLIKIGVGIVGRQRVVGFVAPLIANLISRFIGPDAARTLSTHIADTGLGLLGLEAEHDPTSLGAEALVATVEDTAREVFALPPESLENELLVAAVVQEEFAEAAARYLPDRFLRADLAGHDDERGVWVMMPRHAGRTYRYKQYSRPMTVTLTRPLATRIVMAEGDTLADRLEEAAANDYPVQAEVELFEGLPGAELGHLAAFEGDDLAAAVGEFEPLSAESALPLRAKGMAPARAPGRGPGRGPVPGTTHVRIRVRGARLRARRLFSVRFDPSSPQPELTISLHVGEQSAHTLVQMIERRQHVQILAILRRRLGPVARQRLSARLQLVTARRRQPLPSATATRLADDLADRMLRALAEQLPTAAATLSAAAKDPAPGVTVGFTFRFPGPSAVGQAAPTGPTVTITPGGGGPRGRS